MICPGGHYKGSGAGGGAGYGYPAPTPAEPGLTEEERARHLATIKRAREAWEADRARDDAAIGAENARLAAWRDTQRRNERNSQGAVYGAFAFLAILMLWAVLSVANGG